MTSAPSPPSLGSARNAADSVVLKRAARLGLAARGLIYLLIAVLAVRVAVGDGGRADEQGALQAIAQQSFGRLLLWLLVVGFLAYGLWRLGEAAWGRRTESDDKKRLVKRVESLVSGLIYLILAATAFRFAVGGGTDEHRESLTAAMLGTAGGVGVLVALGLVLLATGAALGWRGLKTDFEEQLDRAAMSATTYQVVRRLGQGGYLARGVVVALVGVFVIIAALEHDAEKGGGFDVVLHAVARAPYGQALLIATAAGLACFGLYSFAETRYRRL